jgi:hypothetical protein
MKGGVSLVEDGHTQMWEYGWGDHTVFDLLKIFSQMSPASLIGSGISGTRGASFWRSKPPGRTQQRVTQL